MLGQRRRRGASIKTTLAPCDCPAVCVFARSICPIDIHSNTQLTQADIESMLVQRLSTIYDIGPTLSQL